MSYIIYQIYEKEYEDLRHYECFEAWFIRLFIYYERGEAGEKG